MAEPLCILHGQMPFMDGAAHSQSASSGGEVHCSILRRQKSPAGGPGPRLDRQRLVWPCSSPAIRIPSPASGLRACRLGPYQVSPTSACKFSSQAVPHLAPASEPMHCSNHGTAVHTSALLNEQCQDMHGAVHMKQSTAWPRLNGLKQATVQANVNRSSRQSNQPNQSNNVNLSFMKNSSNLVQARCCCVQAWRARLPSAGVARETAYASGSRAPAAMQGWHPLRHALTLTQGHLLMLRRLLLRSVAQTSCAIYYPNIGASACCCIDASCAADTALDQQQAQRTEQILLGPSCCRAFMHAHMTFFSRETVLQS